MPPIDLNLMAEQILDIHHPTLRAPKKFHDTNMFFDLILYSNMLSEYYYLKPEVAENPQKSKHKNF